MPYYDDLGRTITTYAQHYLGGTANTNNYDLNSVTYDFTNAPTTTTRKHFTTASLTTPALTISNTFIYDHVGRKLKTWEQIQNGSNAPTAKTLISKIDYNEIDQVINKSLHSTDSIAYMQSIAYAYNERGWLTSSTAALFQMQLQYNVVNGVSGITPKAQYNGNIASQSWGTSTSPNTKSYTYLYDKMNRLKSGTSTDNNNENAISYDLQGNITALTRTQGGTAIDILSYVYNVNNNPTNQLQSITDGTTSDLGLKHGTFAYTYDGNGNLITDPSKGASGVTLSYNLLNLPQLVTGSKTITYTYDATGSKLSRVSPITGNTYYIKGIQYDGTTSQALSFIQTEEGKAVPVGANYNYVYYLGDNLGNTRVTFDTQTGSAALIQADNYYPFGMEQIVTANGTKNEYLYNKKELQEELGEYDYGARFYDPVIGKWGGIDPLSETNRKWSTYNYVKDNPITRIDPDGMKDVAILIAKDGAQGYGHMGSVIQDGKGNYYYITMGMSGGGNTSDAASGGTGGQLSITPLPGAKSMTDAVNMAKQDHNNSEYTDQVTLKTTPKQDQKIYDETVAKAVKVNTGQETFNIYTNTCEDAVEKPISSATGALFPNNIKPNHNFKNLKINQSQVQNDLDVDATNDSNKGGKQVPIRNGLDNQQNKSIILPNLIPKAEKDRENLLKAQQNNTKGSS